MPRTSVKIWQRSARRAAASATAVVSLPPRPRVVISWSIADVALWPWKPATMTTFPPSSSARTRRGSMPAIRARPYVPSVVMPACGPLRLMAGTPIACRAIETSVALWCSPVASRTSSSRGSGSSVMPAARPSSSSVVSPMADTTTTRSWPAARSRAIRRATRLMRSAPATDEPPNFWTTRGLGIARPFYPWAGIRRANLRSTVSTPSVGAARSRHVLRPRQPAAHRPDRGRGDRRRARRAHGARRQPVRGVPRPARRRRAAPRS